ncbi:MULTISPECIES: AraC family transcriptional regulator [Burkholderia]|jgi:AraC-like DNA-binding protein|uniref:AraC family transcriptional regulator n=1 Tax=Burkholderia TaxID=32008 RepID=UPI00056A9150|nr:MULTISPECIES: AraC family transcriptional regulator [Burkholderia]ASD83788.1 AraC family transcriptional regulator [Burkholderia gladioli pv. gladioli]AWY51212.1 AraC family transcriptional regulator [Burkholderia gladioli pv. gladioli]MBJ9660747.1 AraC family transcriptional regulator [Burkholderia gladioli]MBU9275169.1 AraC family transcriptional regulator [Burkholderia gladioli]MBU9321003.1 AraC family transcriptional regulator [Burkholderia gladioli]
MSATRNPAEHTELSASDRKRMIALLRDLAPDEGYNLTALPSVRILRSNRALSRTPVLYDPGIVIVCQGRKRGYFGEQLYLYDEQHYLAVSVPVPFSMETEATPERPLLALYLHLDFTVAAELAAQIDREGTAEPVRAPQSMMSTPMDEAMQASVLRFLEAMHRPLEAAVLGPGLLRELYFRVLTGAQGASMREALAMRGQFGRIGRSLRLIHAAYAQPLDVAQLAGEAGMSTPSFHSHFKAITQVSPMQYLKSTRLHQARLLMVRQDLTAEAAGHAVGYTSASQFSREFKRLFGATPAAETRRMRESFAVPEPFEGAVYVSSH